MNCSGGGSPPVSAVRDRLATLLTAGVLPERMQATTHADNGRVCTKGEWKKREDGARETAPV